VADAYEAMTSERPYRHALAPEAAAAELRREAGSQFRVEVVEALLRAV
jgi:HD-GYP domain-containing protein (c-di-GMP phosphodiesterase class II)